MERAPTSKPVSRMQIVVATLLGLGRAHDEIATQLSININTVRWHLKELAKRIPGDLPAEARVVAWVRGATQDVLEGKTLRYEIMLEGERAADTFEAIEAASNV